MQVSAECVYTCAYLLAVAPGAEHHGRHHGSCFAMRRILHPGIKPHQGTILEDRGASMKAIAMRVGYWERGEVVGPSHDDAGPNPNIVQTKPYPQRNPLPQNTSFKHGQQSISSCWPASLWRCGDGVADGSRKAWAGRHLLSRRGRL